MAILRRFDAPEETAATRNSPHGTLAVGQLQFTLLLNTSLRIVIVSLSAPREQGCIWDSADEFRSSVTDLSSSPTCPLAAVIEIELRVVLDSGAFNDESIEFIVT
ncbi:MAG: hypothetical protein EG824_03815 [Deltaproteobacteria bacterium]|nr:hypothetical protein [Deltaproteobacteria bacterium]